MLKTFAVVTGSLLVFVIGSNGFVSPLYAQARTPQTTYEGTVEGGWSGPCEESWAVSDFPFNALRICRVATYLVRSLSNTLNPIAAQGMVNQLFRICWGHFPRAGGDCNIANARAMPKSWTSWAGRETPSGTPPPIVITLQASELVQSDDEMAFLLSHEMGHAIDQQQTSQPSRENEYRADVLGIGFVVKAGYDARAAGRALQMIGGERGKGAIGNLLGMLLNHVDQAVTQDIHGFTQERIARMQEVYLKGCAGLNNKPIGCKEGWR